jgi:hypothetical protein
MLFFTLLCLHFHQMYTYAPSSLSQSSCALRRADLLPFRTAFWKAQLGHRPWDSAQLGHRPWDSAGGHCQRDSSVAGVRVMQIQKRSNVHRGFGSLPRRCCRAALVVMQSSIGNPNAGGAGFKRLSGKKKTVDPVRREADTQAWFESLTPEEQQTVRENERLHPIEGNWNVTQRMIETGCGHFDENGKFIEGFSGRSIVWDKDPDSRWILHQCPISELPAAILRRDRFLHAHPGYDVASDSIRFDTV